VTRLRTQVAIAGAGLAGMALALRLARQGVQVHVLERRSRPGGAIHTLPGPHGGMDNSVHLFLAAFHRCLALLKEIGAESELLPLEPWALVADQGRLFRLPMGKRVLASLPELFTLGPLRAGNLGRALLRVRRGSGPVKGETASQWLLRRDMVPAAFESRFWREWAISVFNTPLDLLDAGLFHRSARLLFSDPRLQRPLVAASTLERLWILPLERALRESGVQLHTACPVLEARREGGRVVALRSREVEVEFQHLVWAAPPGEMARVVGLKELAPALPTGGEGRHIVNVRLPVSRGTRPVGGMRGWFGEAFQWMFDAPGGEAVLVGSAWTDEHVSRRQEVRAHLPRLLARHGLSALGEPRWLVQRHATPLQSPVHEAARPPAATPLENLWLCGAWLDTGLPASMEGALAGTELCHQAMADRLP
jgi:phytoene dehydrogenase-like protein